MNHFEFQFFTTNPNYTFDDLNYDVADIFESLIQNPAIASVDIFSRDGEMAALLIATDLLTISEIEALLLDKFSEAGRDPQNYILLTPESPEV